MYKIKIYEKIYQASKNIASIIQINAILYIFYFFGIISFYADQFFFCFRLSTNLVLLCLKMMCKLYLISETIITRSKAKSRYIFWYQGTMNAGERRCSAPRVFTTCSTQWTNSLPGGTVLSWYIFDSSFTLLLYLKRIIITMN